MAETSTKTTQPEKEASPPSQAAASHASWNRFMLKAKYSLYSTLLFIVFANPETFLITQNIFGSIFSVIHSSGVPTSMGFLLHIGLFFTTMLGLMMLPAE